MVAPKRPLREVKALTQRAFALLAEGFDTTEIAQELGVSQRSVQRWILQSERKEKAEKFVEEADASVYRAREIVGEDRELDDLEEYRSGQKWFALKLGALASSLLPLVEGAIAHTSPEDISPRLLPPLIKSLVDLSAKSSDCWSRATGIEERVRREVDKEVAALLDKLRGKIAPSVYATIVSTLESETERDALNSFVESSDFAELSTDELLRIANGDLSPLRDRVV